MQIYVACLAAYNNGHLHGEWIAASSDREAMQDSINKILKSSPIADAEEWAIHDFEGFGSLQLSEYEGLENICEYAEFYEEHGELGLELLAHFNDIKCAKEALENNYHGEYESEEDFTYSFVQETSAHEIPKHLEFYIDYEKMTRDFFINDFYSIEVNNSTHVFSHH
jgi:antirestriction protein